MEQLEEELESENGFFTNPLVVECAIQGQNKFLLTIYHDESVITNWQLDRIVDQFSHQVQELINASTTT